MLTERQVARFVGEKPSMVARNVQRGILPTYACQDLGDLRFPGLKVVSRDPEDGAGLLSGCALTASWDPPAGGFAAGDIIGQLPFFIATMESTTLVAAQAYNTAVLGFAPGVFEIWIDNALPVGASFNNVMSWVFSGCAAGDTIASPLGPMQPSFELRMIGTGGSASRQFPAFRLMAEKRWSASLVARSSWADAVTGQSCITVVPRMLFNEAGNVF